ncbi:hypothetical protein SFRURICE_000509, partial [Spodoptera frugiperda]
MTVTLGLNMRLISSLSSNMFRRRISIHGQFRLYKQGTSCKNQPVLGSGHRTCHVVGPPYQYNAWEPWFPYPTIAPQCSIDTGVLLHGMHDDQNLTPVDFYMKYTCLYRRNWPCIEILLRNIFEDNDEIRRIFSPRVTVIEIRKRIRACIRHRG